MRDYSVPPDHDPLLEPSLAAAVASAVPSPNADITYLQQDCGGIPSWEVELLVRPSESPRPLTPTEENRLLSMAASAREHGDAWRAHTLVEQAYVGSRSLTTLLYLLSLIHI